MSRSYLYTSVNKVVALLKNLAHVKYNNWEDWAHDVLKKVRYELQIHKFDIVSRAFHQFCTAMQQSNTALVRELRRLLTQKWPEFA
jgi:hypothetical protein